MRAYYLSLECAFTGIGSTFYSLALCAFGWQRWRFARRLSSRDTNTFSFHPGIKLYRCHAPTILAHIKTPWRIVVFCFWDVSSRGSVWQIQAACLGI